MFLRTLMVVAVAALGIEAPSGLNLSRLTVHGHALYEAGLTRLEAWSRLGGEPPVPVAASNSAPAMPNGSMAFADEHPEIVDADQRFAGVVAGMVSDFTPTGLSDPANLELEIVEQRTNDDLYPGLAHALNREAEGLDLADLEPIVVVTVPEMSEDELEDAITPGPGSRTERVEVAVRLTGQAIHAWLSLVQVMPTE